MKYLISKKAGADLENIWLYTLKKWSIAQADRYFKLIINEIKHLAQHPESGEDYSHIRKGYYRSRVKSHFIFYKINPEKELIEIIRILHQRMDIPARLKE